MPTVTYLAKIRLLGILSAVGDQCNDRLAAISQQLCPSDTDYTLLQEQSKRAG